MLGYKMFQTRINMQWWAGMVFSVYWYRCMYIYTVVEEVLNLST